MIFRHIYHRELAQASYLVGCAVTGEALVIDPNRDIDQYIKLAEAEGLRVTAVTETHIHADFVSGARQLAEATGAQLYLSGTGPSEWQYDFAAAAGAKLLYDGDSFMVGRIRLTALHTPGHTPEHISFLLTDTPASEDPMGIFTGDFVFVSEVGRPDLLEKAAGIAGSTDGAARALFHSLQRFRDLPDHLQLWPGHGAGSACGRTIGAVPQSTVGYEKMTNWAFKVTDEDRFVEAVLDGQPEPPPYFARMKQINKVGPAPLPAEPPLQPLTPADLHTALAADTPIVDLRPAADYAERHVPGAISLPLNGSFLNWAGWLLPADQPLAFIGAAQQVQAARRLLTLIGLDHIAGFWTPTICGSWATEPSCQTRESLTADQLAHLLADQAITVIDVRKPDEYTAGHIAGSINLPLGSKLNGETPLGAAGPVVVYCQSGERSAIAAGLLQAKGQVEVYNLVGGIQQWLAEGQPTE